MIRWEELTVFGMLVRVLRLFFAKCRGKQESPPTFILSNHGKGKRIEKTFFSRYSEYGGWIIEREGVSTLSIHGFPWDLRYLLIFKLLVCVF